VPPVASDSLAPVPPSPWQTPDGKGADEQAVDRVIDRLATLKCDGFIVGRSKGDFTNPIFAVRIDASEPDTLLIFDKGSGAKYPAVSSQSDYPFYLADWSVKQIMKKPDELMGKKETAAQPKP
jgi:hypothetical protein